MQMSETELDQISLRSFFNKITGFRKLERDAWERTRTQTFLLLSPHFEKNATVLPQELMPFPWDKEITKQVVDKAAEAKESRDRIFAEIDAQKKNKAAGWGSR